MQAVQQFKKLIRKTVRIAGYELHDVLETDDTARYVSFPRKSVDERRFYNIGAGAFFHPTWTNVDKASEWYRTAQANSVEPLSWDLLALTPLPIEDGSAEIVYTSHCVEHVPNDADQNLFHEAHRVLKKGGVFRMTTPDIDLAYRAYRANDRTFFYWTDAYKTRKAYESIKLSRPWNTASIQQLFLYELASSASTLHADGVKDPIADEELDRFFAELPYEEALDRCVSRASIDVQNRYPGNHINWWNREKAFRMLAKAGFQEIYLSGYGQSASPPLRNTDLFDSTHPKISLYVEAIK